MGKWLLLLLLLIVEPPLCGQAWITWPVKMQITNVFYPGCLEVLRTNNCFFCKRQRGQSPKGNTQVNRLVRNLIFRNNYKNHHHSTSSIHSFIQASKQLHNQTTHLAMKTLLKKKERRNILLHILLVYFVYIRSACSQWLPLSMYVPLDYPRLCLPR